MPVKYEALNQDFPTAEAAIAAVEQRGEGSVVKFIGHPNMPGCWPDIVYRSCDLWSFQNGEWWSHFIFDGTGGKLKPERPH